MSWKDFVDVVLLRDIRNKLNLILDNQRILEREIMALNSEVKAYADRVTAAVQNIAADIQRILANQTTVLSDEDRATLEAAVSNAEALAAQNPD